MSKSLKLDDGIDVGNSPGDDARGRLHVKISNKNNEAIPMRIEPGGTTYLDEFDIATAIPPDTETEIVSLIAPANFFLQAVHFDGANIAHYRVYVDNVLIREAHTYFGSKFFGEITFKSDSSLGKPIPSGSVIKLTVEQYRVVSARFTGTIQGVTNP